MLRLRSSILTHILSVPATSHVPSIHRLISAAAPAISSSPRFAIEDYLVDTCGLTPAQALKASRKLFDLKSPSRPDAVLAFLAGLGLSTADVTAVVAKDPRLLCADVEKTLSSNVAGLTGLGFSRSEIARLVLLGRERFRSRSVVSQLQGYLLRPRYYVVKFLKANGFLDRYRSYYSAVMVTEKVFVEKYICPHKEAAPHLAEDYADACRGQVPMRFRFE